MFSRLATHQKFAFHYNEAGFSVMITINKIQWHLTKITSFRNPVTDLRRSLLMIILFQQRVPSPIFERATNSRDTVRHLRRGSAKQVSVLIRRLFQQLSPIFLFKIFLFKKILYYIIHTILIWCNWANLM